MYKINWLTSFKKSYKSLFKQTFIFVITSILVLGQTRYQSQEPQHLSLKCWKRRKKYRLRSECRPLFEWLEQIVWLTRKNQRKKNFSRSYNWSSRKLTVAEIDDAHQKYLCFALQMERSILICLYDELIQPDSTTFFATQWFWNSGQPSVSYFD